MTPQSWDAIVIGAGIVGAAVAVSLAEDGRRVLVLESGFAGGGATSTGMGHLVVMDDSPTQLGLTSWAVRLWRELAPELGPAIESEFPGTLWIAENEQQLAACRAKQHLLDQAAVPCEILDPVQLQEAEPHLAPGMAGALLVHGDGILYPPGAALALLKRAQALGSSIQEQTRVTSIETHAVRTGEQRHLAPFIVVAAGGRSPQLVPGLPVVPRRGHLVITDRVPGLCRHQLVELGYLASAHRMTSESAAFNLQPRPTGQVLIGSSRELVGWSSEINPRMVHRMMGRAAEMLPAIRLANCIRTWVGFRPATPDKLPLIGPWDESQGTWIATGHEGLGITLALATGQLVADMTAGRRSAVDPAPFHPHRPMPELET